MTAFAEPVVAWQGATGDDLPLVVLLRGRGSNWPAGTRGSPTVASAGPSD